MPIRLEATSPFSGLIPEIRWQPEPSMLLEWIRRKDPVFDKELREFLFTDKPLTHD